MAIFTKAERGFVDAVVRLMYCNPFLPERIECERAALGDAFEARGSDWNLMPQAEEHANVRRLLDRCGQTLDKAGDRLREGRSPRDDTEARRYEELVMFAHYHRYRDAFDQLVHAGADSGRRRRSGKGSAHRVFEQFRDQLRHCCVRDMFAADDATLAHWFACFFQVRRAFANISRYILGVSGPAVGLRAAVWQSIFTHDLPRYQRVLFDRMADQTTLITGPSGTGKELVARAVGMSQYIAFDVNAGRFATDVAASFAPLHLAALSPTLIESELFGHCRGAFTGAVADRVGWLENSPESGTVFLDELGELEPSLQVKLLRVIQERTFSRLGETRQRVFHGKLIAATNQDLAALMRQGRFRSDLYYRICSDIIRTPGLDERIRNDERELDVLLTSLCRRIVDDEAESLGAEVRQWIDRHLPPDYAWPGNVRELDQCVRNVMIRRRYEPVQDTPTTAGPPPIHDGQPVPSDASEDLAHAIETTSLTADELVSRYCTLAYARLGNYQQVARILGLDRRTVRARVDGPLLDELRQAYSACSNMQL